VRPKLKGKKLNRNTKQRKALFKNLINALIVHGQIKTTISKAKAVKKLVDKLMIKAKQGTVHSRRQILAFLADKKAAFKLIEEIAPSNAKRSSGFTRFARLDKRRGDDAMMVRLELVDQPAPKKAQAKKDKVQKPAEKVKKRLFGRRKDK
jgi:large subunit ribosomal protein L17